MYTTTLETVCSFRLLIYHQQIAAMTLDQEYYLRRNDKVVAQSFDGQVRTIEGRSALNNLQQRMIQIQ